MNLSMKQLQIVTCAAAGLTDKETALRLGVTHATISTHWVRLRGKMGATSRTQATCIAFGIVVDVDKLLVAS